MKTKLGVANERAVLAGRDPLIQRGAIVKSGRSTYLVESVRGSTVTVRVLIPWHKIAAAFAARAAARIARRLRIRRPAPPEKKDPRRPAALPALNTGDKMTVKQPINPWWIVVGTVAAIAAAILIWGR